MITLMPAITGAWFGMNPLINFVMRAERLQQDGLGAFVLNELEDDPHVVAGAAGP